MTSPKIQYKTVFKWARTKACLKAVFFVLAVAAVFLYTRAGVPTRVEAATSDEINFQARLLDDSGAIVPDGNYHVEFKLYDDLSAGNLLWTETYTTGNLVEVKSGYLSVHLGELTAFPNTISWDQDLYLTMNVGGRAGAAVWDGEMTPRLKLTAVPFAFAAGQLSQYNGTNTGTLSFGGITNNPDIKLPDIGGTNNVLLQSGTTLLTQGSVPFVDANGRLTQDNTNFYYDSANGRLGIGTNAPNTRLDLNGALSVRGMSAPAIAPAGQARLYFDVNDNGLYLSRNGDSFYQICDFSGNCSGAGDSVTQSGDNVAGQIAYFTSDNNITSTSAFFWDTTNARMGIGTNTPSAKIDIQATFTPATTGNTTNSGAIISVNNSTAKTADTDTTYGQQISVSRSGATGGTINSVGLDINVVGDGGGTSTTRGLQVAVSGADTNYAATFTGGNVGIGTATPDAALEIVDGEFWMTSTSLASSLQLKENTTYWELAPTNGVNFQFTGDSDSAFSVIGSPTGIGAVGSTGQQFIVVTEDAARVGAVIRGITGQTGNLLEIQDENGNINAFFNATGNQLTLGKAAATDFSAGLLVLADGTSSGFASTFGTQTLTANRTIDLPDEDGIVCIQNSTNCGFASAAGSGAYIQNDTVLQTNANFNIQSDSASSVTGAITQLTGQTANLLEFRDPNGLVNASFNSNGSALTLGRISGTGTVTQGQLIFSDGTNSGYGLTLISEDLSTTSGGAIAGNKTYTFPNSSSVTDIVCLYNLGNCAGAGGGVTTDNEGPNENNQVAFFVGASGTQRIESSANFLFDGTDVTIVNDLTVDTNTLFVDSANGRVGIGTITPSAKFDLVGGDMLIDNNRALQARDSGNVARNLIALNTSNNLILGSTGIADVRVNVGSVSNALVVQSGTGNVGIGNATPVAKLDVAQSSTASTADTLQGTLVTVTDTGAVSTGTDTTYGQRIIVNRTGATGGTIATYGLDIQATGDGGGNSALTGLRVNVTGADTNYAALFTGGNVGIGTSTPGYTLDVAGTIRLATLGAAANAQAVCRNASTGQFVLCDTVNTTGSPFLNGGNTFGAVADLGTNDNFALNFRTNGTTRMTLGTAGDLTFTGSNTISTSQADGSITLNPNGTGTLTLGSTGTGSTIQIGNTTGAVNQSINIGNNNTSGSSTTLVLGSTVGSSTTTIQAGSGGIVLNASTLSRTAAGTTTLNLIDAADTTLALTNSGAGVLNVTVDGSGTFGGVLNANGGTINIGQANVASGVINLYNNASGFAASIITNALDQNTQYRLINQTGETLVDICLSTGNCSGAGNSVTTDQLAQQYQVAFFNTAQEIIGDADFTFNGSEVGIGVTGTPSSLLSIGGTTGNLTVIDSGDLTTAGNIAINGGTLSSTATTFNVLNTGVTTANVLGAATTISIGADTGTTMVNNNLNVDDTITAGTGLSVTTGNVAITAGNLTTGGTIRLTNAGALDNITGYTQTSGNFDQQGNGTFSTGSGTVSLNGSTTVTGSGTFTVNGGATTLTGAATGTALTISNSTSTGNILVARDNATTVMTVADGGAVTLQNSTDSVQAFAVLDQGGNNVFLVDTSAGLAVFGDSGNINGGMQFYNDTNTNTVSLLSGATTASYNLFLPTSAGIAGECLLYTAGGQLEFGDCASGTGTAILQGGNDFGGTTAVRIGSINNGNLEFETNDILRLTLDTSGNLTFAGSNTITTGLTNGNLTVNPNGTGTLTLGNTGTASTVQIGNTTGAVAQTINIGNNGTASSSTNVVLGSTVGTSQTTLQAGTGGIIINASTLRRTAAGTTTLDLVDAANTTLALTNSGTGNANLTVDGNATLGTGLTITAGDVAVVAGNLSTGGAIRLTNAGALNNITGYTQTSGNFEQQGTGTFQTGTGNVTLRGNTSVANGSTFTVTGGASVLTGASTGVALTVNNSTSTGAIFVAQDNGAAVFTVADGGGVTATGNLTVQGTGSNTFSGQIVLSNVATDITTGTDEDLTLLANGAGQIVLNDAVRVATLGTAANVQSVCRNTVTGQLIACDTTNTTGTAFLDGGNSFGNTGDLGTNDNFALNFRTNNATRLTLGTNGDLNFAAANTISTSLLNGGLTVTANGTGTLTLGSSGNVSIGNGTGTFALNSSAFDVSTTGALSGITTLNASGLITGTGGLTVSGAAVNLNAGSNFPVNIATGTSTGQVSIGGGNNAFVLDSTGLDIASNGAITVNGAATTGLSFANTGVTTDISLQNGETIDNNVDGVINFGGADIRIGGNDLQDSSGTVRLSVGATNAFTGNLTVSANTDIAGTLAVGTSDAFTVAANGNTVTAGTLAVNGTAITTSQTSFSLFNTTATTINFGGAATDLQLGATSGSGFTTINNAANLEQFLVFNGISAPAVSTAGTSRIYYDSTDNALYVSNNTSAYEEICNASGNCAGAGNSVTTNDGVVNRVAYFVGTQELGTDDNLFFDGNNVGIGGVLSPTAKLDVLQSTNSSAGTTIGQLTTVTNTTATPSGTDTTVGQRIALNRSGGAGNSTLNNFGLDIQGNTTTSSSTSSVNTTGINVSLTGTTTGTSSITGLRVNVSGADANYAALFTGGNVGIGNTAPTSALDLSGAFTVRGLSTAAVSPAGQSRIYFDSDDNKLYVSNNASTYNEVCDSSGNCAGAGNGITGSGTSGQVAFFDAAQNITSSTNLLFNGTNFSFGGGGAFSIDSSAFDVTTAGAVSGVTTLNASGLITGTGGLSITGATNINTSGLAVTNIGTGTSTGAVTIGSGSNTFALNSSAFDVSTAGALSGITGYTQGSGNFAISGNGTFSTGTGTISLNGDTTVTTGNDLVVTDGLTTLGGALGVTGVATFNDTINANGGTLATNQTTFNLLNTTATTLNIGGAATTINIGAATGTTTLNNTLNLNDFAIFQGMAAPAVSSAGTGRIYFDSTNNQFYVSQNGSTYEYLCNASGNCAGAGSGITGSGAAGQIAFFDAAQNIISSSNLTFNGTNFAFGGGGDFSVDSSAFDVSTAGALSGITGYTQASGNFDQQGTGTFSTGTGAISLNGNTGVTGTNTFTVGTGATSLGGTLGVTGAATLSNTLGVTGLTTLSGGLTASGAVNVNTSGTGTTNIGTGTSTGAVAIGSGSNTFALNSSAFDVSAAGALSGITTLNMSGNLIQSAGSTISAGSGFKINGANAAAGTYLRGDGTNFVASSLLAGDLTGTIFNTSADTGSSTLEQGNTLTINGSTNGIDTSLSGDTYTVSLDATEISTATFGAGANFIWTFDTLGATSPQFNFNGADLDVTAADTSLSGTLNVTGGTTLSSTLAVSGNTTLGGTLGVTGATTLSSTLSVASTSSLVGALTLGNDTATPTTGSIVFNDATATNGNTITLSTATALDNDYSVSMPVPGGAGTLGTSLEICYRNDPACGFTTGATGITGSGDTNGIAYFDSGNSITSDATLLSFDGANFSYNNGTGNFSVNSDAFDVTEAGAVSGITSLVASGQVTFSNLGAGLVQADSSGVLTSGAVDRNSATYFSNALNVSNGGTGRTSMTAYGLLAGGATSSGQLQQIGTGTTGQVLISGGSGALASFQDAVAANTCTDCLRQAPTTNGQNTITPSAGVTGLTVNGSATAATALVVNQSRAANGFNLNLTNTTGTQDTGLLIDRNGIGGTTTNLLQLSSTSGTAGNALRITGTYGNYINAPNFVVSGSGSVTAVGVNSGTGLIQGTGGLTAGGTITFSGLNTVGLLTTNASGVVSTGAVDRNSSNYFSNALNVNNGGTGASTLTQYGILYGNGTGAIQTTAVGQTGQCLTGSTGNAPVWAACSTTPVFQTVYDNDPDGSDTLLSLTNTDGSVIFRNPAVGGSTSGYVFGIEQLNTGAVAGLQVTNAGTGNLVTLNASGTGASANGLVINQTGSGTITDGIDVSAAAIVNAINVGDNTILGTTATIDFTNFDVSSTGAVTAVGVNSGTGQIQGTGGLSVTGTTNMNTTGGAATNIGNGGTGAVSIGNTTGGVTLGGNTTISGTSTLTVSGGATSLGGTLGVTGAATLNNTLSVTGTSALVGALTVGNDTASPTAGLIVLNDATGSNGNTINLSTAANLSQDYNVSLPNPGGALGANLEICYRNDPDCGFTTNSNGITAGTTAQNQVAYFSGANELSSNANLTYNGTNFAFGGGGTFAIDSSAFDVTTAGAVSGVTTLNASGLITGTAGLTVSGAVINLNNNSNFATNINTGTSTGAVSIGGGSNAFSLNSTAFDVSSTGAISGITGYSQTAGNFAISGSGTFSTGTGTVSLNGDTTVATGNNLTVSSGATSLGGTLGVTGAATLSSTLGVTGATTLSSTLNVTGATTLNSTLSVTGTSALVGALTIGNDVASPTQGNIIFHDATGINANTLSLTTAANLAADYTVSLPNPDGTLGANLEICYRNDPDCGFATGSGSGVTAGTTSTNQVAYFTGATELSSNANLTYNGTNFAFGGGGTFAIDSSAFDVTAGGIVSGITGYSQASGNFSIGGTGTFSTGSGTVNLNGNTSVTGTNTLTVGTGATSLGGTLGVTGATTLSSTLGVTGATSLGSTLSVTGASSFIGALTAGNDAASPAQGTIIFHDGTGSNANTLTLSTAANLAADYTVSLPNPDGTLGANLEICYRNDPDCGFATGSGSGITAGTTAANQIAYFTGTTQLSSNANLTYNGTNFAFGGGGTFAIDSSAFDVTAAGVLSGITGYSQSSGNFAVSGSGTFSTGTGAVSLNGNTTVSGTTTFNGNTSVTGTNTLTVGTGATSLGGTLGVTGATTLSSTLNVTGAATLNSTLNVTGTSTLVGALTLGNDTGSPTAGSIIFNDPTGSNARTISLSAATLGTSSFNVTLPDGDGTDKVVCYQNDPACGFATGSGSGITAGTTAANQIAYFTGTTQLSSNANLTYNGTNFAFGGGGTFAIDSSAFDVTSTGVVSGATGISSSGNIDFASLNAGGLVKADATTGRLSIATAGTDYENPLTFNNGLTRTSNNVQLGGALTQATTVTTGNNFGMTFNLADTATDANFVVNIQGTGNTFQVQDGGTSVFTIADGGNVTMTADLAVNGGDITTTSTIATLFNTNVTDLSFAGAATTLTVGATTGNTTVRNNLAVNGNLTVGDAAADTVTVNASSFTIANDTNFALTGGTNGLSFDGTTFSVDAANNRIGIGTAAPQDMLHVTGVVRIDTLSSTQGSQLVCRNASNQLAECSGSSVQGTGVAGQVAYFNGTGTITSNAGFLFSDTAGARSFSLIGDQPAGNGTTAGATILNVTGGKGQNNTLGAAPGQGGGISLVGGAGGDGTVGSNGAKGGNITLQGGAPGTGGTPAGYGDIIMNASGGNVGIGDSTPSALLTVGNGDLFQVNSAGNVTTRTSLTFAGGASTISTSAANAALTLQTNGTGALTLDSGTTGAINLGTGANAKTITVGNASGATALNFNSGTGGTNFTTTGNYSFSGTTTTSYTLGTGTTTGTITIGGAGQTGAITLGSSTGSNTINIGTGTGTTTINVGTGSATGNINIGTAKTSGAITIGGTGAMTGAINIGTGTGAQSLNFGTGGTGAKTVTVGSTAGTSGTTIQSGSTGITLSGVVTLPTLSSTAGTQALCRNASNQIAACAGTGITGSGAANQIAYFNSGSTITSSSSLYYNGTNFGLSSVAITPSALFSIGGATGNLTIDNSGLLTTVSDAAINGGDLTTTAATATLFNANATTLNIGGGATTAVNIGNASGVTDVAGAFNAGTSNNFTINSGGATTINTNDGAGLTFGINTENDIQLQNDAIIDGNAAGQIRFLDDLTNNSGNVLATIVDQGTTGAVNATGGFQINGAATAGTYLRGDGTNYVSSNLLASDMTGSIFSTQADTGTSTLVSGDTLRIEGGLNGIDTILSGDTYTLNLDYTEINDAEFGSGGSIDWEFNATGTVDTIFSFGDGRVDITTNNATVTGNVGIGTTSPSAKLHVIGAGQAATNTAAPDALVVTGGQGGLGTAGGGTGGTGGAVTITSGQGGNGQAGGLFSSGGNGGNGGNIVLQTGAGGIGGANNGGGAGSNGSYGNIILNQLGGNVGIGTASPAALLSVGSTSQFRVTTGGLVQYVAGTTNTSDLVCQNSSGQLAGCGVNFNNYFVQGGNSFGTTAVLGTNDSQSLQFETVNTVRMTINTAGNIGVGTTSQTARLHVVGADQTTAQTDAVDALVIQGGQGGQTNTNNTTAGRGADVVITAGQGGDGTTGDVRNGGNGGDIILQAGAGGTGGSAGLFQSPGANGSYGNIVLNANGGNVQIGSSTTNATASLLTLDSYNNATDPSGVNGSMYYNSNLGRFRCHEGGVWKDCNTDTAPKIVEKEADESVVSSTTMQNDDHLSFSVAANTAYVIEIWGRWTAHQNGMFKAGISMPAGATIRLEGETMHDADINGPNPCYIDTVTDSCGTDPGSGSSHSGYVRMRGIVQTSGTAGTFNFQWAQLSSSNSATTFQKNSSLFYTTLSGAADLAEIYYTYDTGLAAGHIASVDGSLSAGVKKSAGAYDDKVIGIVSTKPSIVIGDHQDSGAPIAMSLAGRVPVKVNGENGPIKAGDHITTSSVPGVGMKATSAGWVVGVAMSDFDGVGEGEVTVYVNRSYYQPGASVSTNDLMGGTLSLDVASLTTDNLVVSGSAEIQGNLSVQGAIAAVDLMVSNLATVNNLKVEGVAEFAGDIKLTGQVNTRQAITKKFIASEPIVAGSVVVLDETQDGYVKTTTAVADTKVIGVAVNDVAAAGEEVEVAIGGSVQVKVDETVTVTPGAQIITSDTAGNGTVANQDILNTILNGNNLQAPSGSVLGKATSAKDADNLIWVLLLLN